MVALWKAPLLGGVSCRRGSFEKGKRMSHGRIFSRACTIAGVFLGPGILFVTPASAQSPTFNIYGAAQADYIYDGNRVDPNWEDTLRPSKIPTANNATAFGSDGQSSISVKQSRFG